MYTVCTLRPSIWDSTASHLCSKAPFSSVSSPNSVYSRHLSWIHPWCRYMPNSSHTCNSWTWESNFSFSWVCANSWTFSCIYGTNQRYWPQQHVPNQTMEGLRMGVVIFTCASCSVSHSYSELLTCKLFIWDSAAAHLCSKVAFSLITLSLSRVAEVRVDCWTVTWVCESTKYHCS